MVKEFRAYMAKLTREDIFSGAVLVAKAGRPIFTEAYGLQDKASGTANRIDTRFSIASLGKMFTSVAVALLRQKGQLSLDDSIAKFLPDYPDQAVAGRVTVHHLLTHTSGIPDYMDDEQYQSAKRAAGGRWKRLEDYFPFFARKPLLFEPGEKDEYSNSGYIILGSIVEKVTGQRFGDYVRENILIKAGMNDTESSAISPAGGELSTVRDLLKFDRALRHEKLLTRPLTRNVLAAEIVRGTANPYGFEVRRVNGQRIVGHTGGYTGIDAVFDMYLDGDYSVIILSNYDPPAAQHVKNKFEELLTRK
jgi:CubicO group peptidase (beta-lactamase class C family)